MYKNRKYIAEPTFLEMQKTDFVLQMSHAKRDKILNIRIPEELKARLTYARKEMSEADYIITVLAYHLRNTRVISEEEIKEWQLQVVNL